jgi:hypothetical protein
MRLGMWSPTMCSFLKNDTLHDIVTYKKGGGKYHCLLMSISLLLKEKNVIWQSLSTCFEKKGVKGTREIPLHSFPF